MLVTINIDGTPETKYYYFHDALGSVVALSNNNGNVVEKYSYDVFGTPTIRNASDQILTTSDFSNCRMFTGREYDSETGNYYYRARYYSPNIGRFLQTDPIGYADSMNLYQYCGNNPVMFVDPWGLSTLGIHSTGSHSWVSYTDDNGKTTTHGLWRKSHSKPETRVRPDSDVHKNKEPHIGAANRYYNNLTKAQEKKLQKEINKKQKYRTPTNNCSSFASDTVKKVTGEDVDADSWFGVETPGELTENIKEKEEKDPTKNESLKKS